MQEQKSTHYPAALPRDARLATSIEGKGDQRRETTADGKMLLLDCDSLLIGKDGDYANKSMSMQVVQE
jgi:hypothetical protein